MKNLERFKITEKVFQEFLDNRFRKYGNTYEIHSWINHGYDYGLTLQKEKDKFVLREMWDSGYASNEVISDNLEEVYCIISCLKPTKKDYDFGD